MKKIIYKFLDDKKFVSIMAKEIAETFQNEACEDNIDYSFSINRKTGKVHNNKANTYFLFDTSGQTILHDFKKALFNEDLEKIKEGSEEDEKLMSDVRDFLLKVCREVTSLYYDNLEETVRRVVLGNKVNQDTVGLKTIEVLSIDIADYSSIPDAGKYLLRIGKKPDSDINTDDVIKFVQNRQEKTGMDIDTIFSIEKKAGNPLFKNIISIEKGRKFLNDISIYFFVDYSIAENAEKTLDK